MSPESKHDAATGALQSIPAAALVGFHFLGLSLSEWAALFGIGFIVLQAAYLIWKWRREASARRR